MITDCLHRVANQRQPLSRQEAREVMTEILTGRCSDAQIAGLLVALRMKGETVEEIVGFAEAMRAAATPFDLPEIAEDKPLVDTCGTGGDAICTFNISTTAAFVVAGAGVRVAKHGNRSNTPKLGTKGIGANCGAADVMEALGISLMLSPEALAACLEEVGIAFLFAPAMHSAMKYVQSVRRELRMRTVFNLLGPLTNPAHATAQVVGVYALELVDVVAEALSMLGLRRALVVHGLDGLDEITISAPTRVAEVRDGNIRTYEITPEEFGMGRASTETVAGADATGNAATVRQILAGEKSPRRDIVLLNAAAALVAASCADHIGDALKLAAQSVDSGAALGKLDALVRFTSAHRS